MRLARHLAVLLTVGVVGCAVPATEVLPNASQAIDRPATVEEVAVRVSVPRPTTTPYVVPIADAARAGWGGTHATYRATDIFVVGGCGASVVSPVNGRVLDVRRVDAWTAAVDNPATRGGRSVAILGDDGVRYYLAHFDTIIAGIDPETEVTANMPLGTVGETGRTSACHVHFGISPPCPEREFSVRRGAVWPFPYLDAWKLGEQLSPAAEVATWTAANSTGCADASSHPNAADS
jgi:murein DD-endopeptidase MepM/ murein hydrolase activator NlpD